MTANKTKKKAPAKKKKNKRKPRPFNRRQRMAVEFYIMGKGPMEAAKLAGYAEGTGKTHIYKLLEDPRAKEIIEKAEADFKQTVKRDVDWKRIQLYDLIMDAKEKAKDNPRYGNLIISAIKELNAMDGHHKPTKIAPTNPEGDAPYEAIDRKARVDRLAQGIFAIVTGTEASRN